MSQNFEHVEIDDLSHYVVTEVTNEHEGIQDAVLTEEGIEFHIDVGALNLLPDSYCLLPQDNSDLVLLAACNTSRRIEEFVNDKYEEDIELALQSNNIGGNEESKEEIAMPLVSLEDGIFTYNIENAVCGEATAITALQSEQLDICEFCGEHSCKWLELLPHVNAHVNTDEGEFQCEECNRIFSNMKLFRLHKRMHILHHKVWNCDVCQKKYASKNLLLEHYNTHIGVRPYKCTICGKDFASKYTFKAHGKIHEDRPRPFKCTHCDNSFLSQQNLTQHLRVHVVLKEFSCPVCFKNFSSTRNLEVHSIVHTGFKPFACTVCNKAFARKAERRDHERTHTGERPYECAYAVPHLVNVPTSSLIKGPHISTTNGTYVKSAARDIKEDDCWIITRNRLIQANGPINVEYVKQLLFIPNASKNIKIFTREYKTVLLWCLR